MGVPRRAAPLIPLGVVIHLPHTDDRWLYAYLVGLFVAGVLSVSVGALCRPRLLADILQAGLFVVFVLGWFVLVYRLG